MSGWIIVVVSYDGRVFRRTTARSDGLVYEARHPVGDAWEVILDTPDLVVQEWQGPIVPGYSRYWIFVRNS